MAVVRGYLFGENYSGKNVGGAKVHDVTFAGESHGRSVIWRHLSRWDYSRVIIWGIIVMGGIS